MVFLLSSIVMNLQAIFVLAWDINLTIFNILTPKLKEGHAIPKGHPGADGKWPEYVAPKEGDSRGSCPALNTMANHGIIPRDGRNISFKEINHAVRQTYNFAPSFTYYVSIFSANYLKKSYSKDRFDLSDLDLHNAIEHDGSLTREDVFSQPDQGKPHVPFIRDLLDSHTGVAKDGSPLLTIPDVSNSLAKRRVDSQRSNPEFTTSFQHKLFGSSNSSGLLTIFGGRVKDLETVLVEERFPEGWEPRDRSRLGLTIAALNVTVFKLERGTQSKEKELNAAVAPVVELPASEDV